MENLIYILAPIAYFLFQGYQNFQKEQEKARKRQADNQQAQGNQVEEVKTEPIILPRTEAVELKPNYKLTREEERIKQIREQMVYEKAQAAAIDYYNPEQTTSKKLVKNKIEKVSKPLQTVSVGSEDDEDFDLRDAIIKEAILKRPY